MASSNKRARTDDENEYNLGPPSKKLKSGDGLPPIDDPNNHNKNVAVHSAEEVKDEEKQTVYSLLDTLLGLFFHVIICTTTQCMQ